MKKLVVTLVGASLAAAVMQANAEDVGSGFDVSMNAGIVSNYLFLVFHKVVTVVQCKAGWTSNTRRALMSEPGCPVSVAGQMWSRTCTRAMVIT